MNSQPIREYRPPTSTHGVRRQLSAVKHERVRNDIQLRHYEAIKALSADIARLDERLRTTPRRDAESRADWRTTNKMLVEAQRKLDQLVSQREEAYERALAKRTAAQSMARGSRKREAWERKLAREAMEQLNAQIFEDCEAEVIQSELDDAKRGLR